MVKMLSIALYFATVLGLAAGSVSLTDAEIAETVLIEAAESALHQDDEFSDEESNEEYADGLSEDEDEGEDEEEDDDDDDNEEDTEDFEEEHEGDSTAEEQDEQSMLQIHGATSPPDPDMPKPCKQAVCNCGKGGKGATQLDYHNFGLCPQCTCNPPGCGKIECKCHVKDTRVVFSREGKCIKCKCAALPKDCPVGFRPHYHKVKGGPPKRDCLARPKPCPRNTVTHYKYVKDKAGHEHRQRKCDPLPPPCPKSHTARISYVKDKKTGHYHRLRKCVRRRKGCPGNTTLRLKLVKHKKGVYRWLHQCVRPAKRPGHCEPPVCDCDSKKGERQRNFLKRGSRCPTCICVTPKKK